MANNKSGGIDNCTAEVLKFLDDENLREIADILISYWQQEKAPSAITKARVVSFYKKGNQKCNQIIDPLLF